MKLWLPILALVLGATLAEPREARGGVTREEHATALLASALRRLAIGTHEQRQFAIGELQDAAKLDPGRSDIALVLGELYLEADLLGRARDVARQLTIRDTSNAAGWLLAGQAWRHDWLETIDERARDRAIASLAHSARLAPREPKAWALLAPLLADADELDAAYTVAVCGARAAPTDAQAQVQLAAAAQRIGDLASAEYLFRLGVPRLPQRLRDRYEDIAPLLPPWSADAFRSLAAPEREQYVQRFWAENDPDPISVENEARLEYWARVTQAASLYGTARPGEWDMRAQYYVRFGRPAFEEINPITKPESLHQGDWLAWTYPDLGLRVWMGTMSMFNGFPAPLSNRSMWAQAWPESLARHGELLALSHGWAVLHQLPPGVERMETRLALAQFRAEEKVSLFAQAEAPGGPADSLAVEWVVLDSAYTTVLRERGVMSASACRPDQTRAASLTATLSPGRYAVAVEVTDAAGHRGVVRRNLFASPASGQLALSDLVVTCSPPEQSIVAGSGVRLEPETGLFPAEGEQLNAYFEIYHLAQSDSGDARFEYDCSVHSATHDPRGWMSRMFAPRLAPAPIQVSRIETTRGSLRRQFLSVPVGSLPTGSYEIAVLVRDVSNGATAKAVARFDRRQ